ncbi:MAG: arsenic resistance N-acetyltransferase ArsN2 [Wenzhouxiangella sp.]|jgi:amino-acid N-acetyltransferase|nr:arsenic resistance N-acetyltransferase ArsN2 [Wenzhouxiangella sp.]
MKTPTVQHLPAIASLLADSGLPTDDLVEQDLSLFRIEESEAGLTAVGGLERCGQTALIRSVATAGAMQGRGIAGRIVEALERLAEDQGFASLYLLTESAERYFESRGYSTVDRAEVPQAVRESRQFSSLCPSSATILFKRVGA